MLNVYKLQNTLQESAAESSKREMKEAFQSVLPIDEATFFGRNKEILKAQDVIEDLIKIARNDRVGVLSNQFTAKQLELAETLRSAFGFKSFSINSSIIDLCPFTLLAFGGTFGCTLVHARIFKAKIALTGKTTKYSNIDSHHQAIKFTDAANYTMRMFIGPQMFQDYGEYSFTSGELLAIFLHEIGHNFDIGPVRNIRDITLDVLSVITAADILAYIRDAVILSEGLMLTTDFIDAKAPKALKDSLTLLYNSVSVLLEPLKGVYSVYTTFLNFGLCCIYFGLLLSKVPLNIAKAALQYDSEKYADTFATAYGYGAELASALLKASHIRIKGGVSKPTQDILDNAKFFLTLPVNLIYFYADEHPHSTARALNNMAYLKACRNTIKDPVLLKEFDEQIEELGKVIDNTKKYGGANLPAWRDKLQMAIGDFTDIADMRNLVSGLRPLTTKYQNLDYTT